MEGTPTDLDIARVRMHIGTTTPPSDDDIYELLLDADTPEAVAETIIATRLADLVEVTPFSLPGFTQGSVAANIEALQKKLAELRVVTGTAAGQLIQSVDLCRPSAQHR